ncbi:MAG: VanZ family protein [Clostridiales bacterium]|nr:VanZ family protein [Clostridiales bacterium]
MADATKIIAQIVTDILTTLYQSFWFSLVLSILFMFFWLYCKETPHDKVIPEIMAEKKERGYKQSLRDWEMNFRSSSEFRRTFFLALYTTMILFRTLLNRTLWLNPLSDVMGGWWLWKKGTDGKVSLTTEPIENFMLFIPFSMLMLWTVYGDERLKDRMLKRDTKTGSILWQSMKVTFLFSVSIEFLQLFLKLGTWQFADILTTVLAA